MNLWGVKGFCTVIPLYRKLPQSKLHHSFFFLLIFHNSLAVFAVKWIKNMLFITKRRGREFILIVFLHLFLLLCSVQERAHIDRMRSWREHEREERLRGRERAKERDRERERVRERSGSLRECCPHCLTGAKWCDHSAGRAVESHSHRRRDTGWPRRGRMAVKGHSWFAHCVRHFPSATSSISRG